MSIESTLGGFKGIAYSLFRIFFGLLFASHGAQKLFGVWGGSQPDTVLMWVAGVVEFVGGLMVALGLLAQIAAFLCAGQMLVAYFYAHFPQGWVPIENRGELALVYLFGFLVVATHGAGGWSLSGKKG